MRDKKRKQKVVHNKILKKGMKKMISNYSPSRFCESEFDWDSQIMGSDRFILLDEGYYWFRVLSLEKSVFRNSENGQACHVAKLRLEIENEKGYVVLNHQIFLNRYSSKKIRNFFDSIGFAQKGSYTPPWDSVVGQCGGCYLIQKKLDFKTINAVDRFVPTNNIRKDVDNEEK